MSGIGLIAAQPVQITSVAQAAITLAITFSLKEQRIIRVISEVLGVSESLIVPDATLVQTFGADSFDMLELCMVIEDEFDVDLDDSELTDIKSVQDIFTLMRGA